MGLKAKKPLSTDYETYREIMGELLSPIMADGLDGDTLKRLYVSKSVYLENLRMKCFIDLNKENSRSYFTWKDYEIIVKARAWSQLWTLIFQRIPRRRFLVIGGRIPPDEHRLE